MIEYDTTLWYGTTSEKILAWRKLRANLAGLDLTESIHSVMSWWTYAPWVRKTIDPYDSQHWPTPWELINRGEFCRSAIALGQAYTLWMCMPELPVAIELINNFSEKDIHLVVVIDEKYLLNYTLGQVLNLVDCEFETLKRFSKQDLNHIKIQ
jgi:hypothetical protein